MSDRPIILLTGEHTHSAGNMGFVPLLTLDKRYISSVMRAGALPLMSLCVCLEEDYCCAADGLILTGGSDIHSGRYHAPCIQGEMPSNVSYERDNLEFDLFASFYKAGKPVLGIGRGMQLINVALGGTLCQQVSPAHLRGSHPLKIQAYDFLGGILRPDALYPSCHRQGVDRLGDGLEAAAVAEDGVIEVLFHKDRPVWGVQFHPEAMDRGGIGERLLSEFVTRCHGRPERKLTNAL